MGLIKRRDPLADATKAIAEQRRIVQERQQKAETGGLGRTMEEREEALRKLRSRQRQARLDQIEACEKLFGEVKR